MTNRELASRLRDCRRRLLLANEHNEKLRSARLRAEERRDIAVNDARFLHGVLLKAGVEVPKPLKRKP